MPNSAPTTTETYISVDVETGGPIPGTHPLLSLGACVVGATDQRFYVEFKPAESTSSLAAALEVTGLNPDELSVTGTEPALAALDFADWVRRQAGGARPVFVAFNAPFDWAFVVRLFFEAGVENPFGHSALDIKAFYMGMCGTSWDDTRSSRLPTAYAVVPEREHHALSDAVAQAVSFERMLRNARSTPRSEPSA